MGRYSVLTMLTHTGWLPAHIITCAHGGVAKDENQTAAYFFFFFPPRPNPIFFASWERFAA